MYFQRDLRYFDRNGEYRVLNVGADVLTYHYIGSEIPRVCDDLEVKMIVDINVRAEQMSLDFVKYCRKHGHIYADISKNQLEAFCSKYERVTGKTLAPIFGVHLRKNKTNAASLCIVLPAKATSFMPPNFHGSWKSNHTHLTIYNSDFVWTLLEQGFHLGGKHKVPLPIIEEDYGTTTGRYLSLATSLPIYEGFGRRRNPDGSISPAEDNGYRFQRRAA